MKLSADFGNGVPVPYPHLLPRPAINYTVHVRLSASMELVTSIIEIDEHDLVEALLDQFGGFEGYLILNQTNSVSWNRRN